MNSQVGSQVALFGSIVLSFGLVKRQVLNHGNLVHSRTSTYPTRTRYRDRTPDRQSRREHTHPSFCSDDTNEARKLVKHTNHTRENDLSEAAGTANDTAQPNPKQRVGLRILLLAAIFVGGIALFRWSPLSEYANPQVVADFFRSLGTPWWSPLVFVPLYAITTALGMPGTVPTLAGGAIFGVARGMLFNTIGANLGALGAFLIARYLGRDFVERVLKGKGAVLDEKIGEHGFSTMLVLRLIPLVPFNALNFGAGISRVSLRDYVLGTLIGMIPGTLVYTYFADALIRGTGEARREAFLHFLLAASLLIAFTLVTGWIRRRVGSGNIDQEG